MATTHLTLSDLKALSPAAYEAAVRDPIGARFQQDPAGRLWELGATHCVWLETSEGWAWCEASPAERCVYCCGWLDILAPGACYEQGLTDIPKQWDWRGASCAEPCAYRQAAHDLARDIIEDEGYNPSDWRTIAASVVLNHHCVGQ